MLRTRVMPCLLLKDSGLVKTIKFKDPTYVGDPINAVRIFNEKEVDELVFLDITATVEGRKPNFEMISNIASEAFMPFGYGGGIRNLEEVRELFHLGVEKVILNSYAYENPSFLRELSELYGSQSVVVSIDVRKNIFGKYEVYTHGGKKNTKNDPISFARKMQEAGAGEVFLTSIDADGTMKGYDLRLIQQVAQSLTIPLVACGGAGKIEDLAEAVRNGASAAAAGSMFVFQGKHRAVLITYPSRDNIEEILT